jgi:hypothetical protein
MAGLGGEEAGADGGAEQERLEDGFHVRVAGRSIGSLNIKTSRAAPHGQGDESAKTGNRMQIPRMSRSAGRDMPHGTLLASHGVLA